MGFERNRTHSKAPQHVDRVHDCGIAKTTTAHVASTCLQDNYHIYNSIISLFHTQNHLNSATSQVEKATYFNLATALKKKQVEANY